MRFNISQNASFCTWCTMSSIKSSLHAPHFLLSPLRQYHTSYSPIVTINLTAVLTQMKRHLPPLSLLLIVAKALPFHRGLCLQHFMIIANAVQAFMSLGALHLATHRPRWRPLREFPLLAFLWRPLAVAGVAAREVADGDALAFSGWSKQHVFSFCVVSSCCNNDN